MLSIPQENKIFALVDANNFYASCEQIFQPYLKNKPVIVLSNNDGCVISRSREAKQIGIKMGQPYFEIKELVEIYKVYVFSSNFRLYADISHRFYEILMKFFPDVEIYSVDECFLNLSGMPLYNIENLIRKARKILYQWIKIPVSIGIANTKTLAKLANKYAKKNEKLDGVCNALIPEIKEKILRELNVENIWGVGHKTEKILKRKGIQTPLDLIHQNDYWIKKKLSIKGLRMVYELRGIPCYETPVSTKSKKSTAISRSFNVPITELEMLEKVLLQFSIKLSEKLNDQKQLAMYLGLYLRTNPFNKKEKYYSMFKSEKLLTPSNIVKDILETGTRILRKIYIHDLKYKKLGLIAMGLIPDQSFQQDIFVRKDHTKEKQFNDIFLKLRKYYNHSNEKITFARYLSLKSEHKIYKKLHLSKNFTTHIDEIPIAMV